MSGRKEVRQPTLEDGVRGNKPVNGGMRLSQASAPDDAEDSKTIRPGQPLKRTVRAMLREVGLQRRG